MHYIPCNGKWPLLYALSMHYFLTDVSRYCRQTRNSRKPASQKEKTANFRIYMSAMQLADANRLV